MKIYASMGGKTIVSKSKLEQQFTEVFRKHMGDYLDPDGGNSAEDYMLRIDIGEDSGAVKVDIEAETYFDQNEMMDYSEYRSIMIYDCGMSPSEIKSKDEYYADMYKEPTLEDAMTAVLKSYNPNWYFELYNACRIQAWLDECILKP